MVSDPPKNRDIITVFHKKIQGLFDLGRYNDCRKMCLECLAIAPNESIAFHFACLASLRLGESKEAIQWAEKLLAEEPDQAQSYNLMALSLACNNDNQDFTDRQKIEAYFQESLQKDPSYAHSYLLYADWLGDCGRLEEALVFGRKSLRLDPNANAYTLLQALYRLNNQMDLAHEMGQKALMEDPERAVNHLEAGFRCLEKGETQKAKSHFRDSLCLQPNEDYFKAIAAEHCRQKILFRHLPILQSDPIMYGIIFMILLMWYVLSLLIWDKLEFLCWLSLFIIALYYSILGLFILCKKRRFANLQKGKL